MMINIKPQTNIANLRSDVLRRAEHLLVRELLRLLVYESFVEVSGEGHQSHLAQTEVRELDMTEGRDEKIVGLQISVNYSEGVKVLHRQNCFRKVKPEK